MTVDVLVSLKKNVVDLGIFGKETLEEAFSESSRLYLLFFFSGTRFEFHSS